ncbi:DUF1524 domain-containing protein [Rhodococcus zopfii]|uniref:DUF1524 domain-containing protein n=1 Tax=Rhodococcus zopfii TaxID=43772 RepID=A0ABU3WU37_9NOCA|nr:MULTISPECIES: DUF1524 domain-containing protein [Rhodococcus]MDV2477537.1 DUF1524 domain-containing protein [Rhodococcus zopfii]WKK14657.1 DUF1524 domain-containing protein [Rhodococcus ruber]
MTGLSTTLNRGGRLVAVVAAIATVTGCGATADPTTGTVSRSAPATATATATAAPAPTEPGARASGSSTSEASAALAVFAELPIKGRAPKTGYDRELFGQAWSDDVGVAGGHNGCDTRNDILRRDLVDIEFKPGTRDCVVLSGTLHDAYTGATIPFTRGQDTSEAVQIDHVVALSDAWQKGAQQLDAQTRADFANDPRNLQAVDGPTNQRKGDGDAATWLPPNRAYRCTYVARQVQVKAAYGLWVTQAEHDAIVRVLTECGGVATEAVPTQAPEAGIPATTREPAPAVPQDGAPVYFENCAAARAAGAAPLYAGQPGYRPEMDGDRDGIACE